MHSWGPQWGPLQLQAAAAAKGVQQGSMLRQHDGRTLIVCPEAAAELLRLHDGGEGVGLCKITNRDRRELLGQALTSVNGADWSRQRPAVVATAGGGISVQAALHAEAVAAAGRLALEHAAKLQVRDVVELAAATAARGIVGAVMGPPSAAIDADTLLQLECVLLSYHKAFRCPREQRDLAVCCSLEAALLARVQRMADLLAPPASHTPLSPALAEPSALLARLLRRPELSRAECVCNANSFLVAGFATTFDVLACSLLHLARRRDVQCAARDGLAAVAGGAAADGPGAATGAASDGVQVAAKVDGTALEEGTSSVRNGIGKAQKRKEAAAAAAGGGKLRQSALVHAIFKGTLRIHPPVLGLERVVRAAEGLALTAPPGVAGAGLPNVAEMAPPNMVGAAPPAGQVHLPPGQVFIVDLLVAAHGTPPPAPLASDEDARRRGSHVTLPSAAAGALLSHARHPLAFVSEALTDGSKPATQPKLASGALASAACEELQGSQVQSPPLGPSWTWDPLRAPAPQPPGEQSVQSVHSVQSAQGVAPFGMGPRSCPAGFLSLVIAHEVLCQPLLRFEWALAEPARDEHWMSRLVGAPTLVIQGPLPLMYTRLKANGKALAA